MKAELLNIINNSNEPVYELDSYVSGLDKVEQSKAWDDLKEIALTGELQQKFIALTVISVNHPYFLESLSFELIKDKNFEENEFVLKPTIDICSILKQKEHINYMLQVLDYALRNNKEYLYELTLRNILTTDSWRKVVSEMIKIVLSADERTIIDMFAFFIYERGFDDYMNLVSSLPVEGQSRINKLDKEIKNRFKESYQKLNRKASH